MANAILGEDAVIAGGPAQFGDHRLGQLQVELVEFLDSRIVEDVGRGYRAVEEFNQFDLEQAKSMV